MDAHHQGGLLIHGQTIFHIPHLLLPQGLAVGAVDGNILRPGHTHLITHDSEHIPQQKADGEVEVLLLGSIRRYGTAVRAAMPGVDQQTGARRRRHRGASHQTDLHNRHEHQQQGAGADRAAPTIPTPFPQFIPFIGFIRLCQLQCIPPRPFFIQTTPCQCMSGRAGNMPPGRNKRRAARKTAIGGYSFRRRGIC